VRGRLVLAVSLTILIAGALAVAPALWAAPGSPSFPKPTGYVNDFAHLLDPAAHASLERRLAEYDHTTGNQIAIAAFPDLGGVPINEFASRLEEAWKVGRRGKDNGVLLLIGLKERQVRIEVGYGLEGKITDGDAGAIIRNILAPAFRAGRYADGLNAAVDELMRLMGAPAGAAPPSTVGSRPSRAHARGSLWAALSVFVAFIALTLLVSRGGGPRCPRDGTRLRLQSTAPGSGALGSRRINMWVCPRCGYREKAVSQGGPMGVPWPMWVGGGGWGTGGFSGGGGEGFGGFGGGSSGGGGASGSW
jgi:uncharacterized protein